jgi:c-di-GMP-binding flagellar brake protein YcgR
MPPPPERREDRRIKTKVPVELYLEGQNSPYRGATADLSLHGCYIESIFPFPIGTNLELKLQLNGTLLVMATVATSDPQVGNGIKFTRMLPEDIEELRAFLEAAEKEAAEQDNGAK